MHCALEFVENVLPSVITAFVIGKDYDSLLLVTGFKLFLLGEKRKIDKQVKKAATQGVPTSIVSDQLLGCSARSGAYASKMPGVDSGRKELMEQTKLLCLSPDKIELILPRILMNPDRSQLVFFLEVVLQRKMSLQQMIASRDKLILKGIVLELGRISDLGSSDHALRTAARARENVTQTEMSEGSAGAGVVQDCEAHDVNKRQADDSTAACMWVTSSFMYLLVNAVQHRWHSRTIAERVQALRCLRWMIKFLLPTEAPKYLPQIMAMINVVMSGNPSSPERSESGTWQLRLIAVHCLSEFIRAAIQCQYEMVGSNESSYHCRVPFSSASLGF